MLRNKLFFLSLTISVTLFNSCNPSIFSLKDNVKIDTLKIYFEYSQQLSKDQIEKLELNSRHFIEEYNLEKNNFRIALIEDSLTADIRFKVLRVKSPSTFHRVFPFALTATSLALILSEPKIGIYTWPFINLVPHSTTKVSWKFSNDLTDEPKKFKKSYFTTEDRWRKREIELNAHLRHFDGQLGHFFDQLEKEYIKAQAE